MNAYDKTYDTPLIKGQNVVVVGGGNVAIDSARCAIRLHAKSVTIIYRRNEKELLARKEEIINAKFEGINFLYLTTPISFISDTKNEKNVKFVECLKMKSTGKLDNSNRIIYEPINETKFLLQVDMVIVAIGTKPNNLVFKNSNLIKKNKNGTIYVDINLQCPNTNIFAGGDIVTGSTTVISAIKQGKKAAEKIIKLFNT